MVFHLFNVFVTNIANIAGNLQNTNTSLKYFKITSEESIICYVNNLFIEKEPLLNLIFYSIKICIKNIEVFEKVLTSKAM